MGAKVIALDISAPLAGAARRRDFGADEAVNPGSPDPVAAIRDLTHGRYADLTLDTSSNSEARPERDPKHQGVGHHVASSARAAMSTIEVSPHLLRPKRLTLVASWTFSNIIQADCARFSGRTWRRCRRTVHPSLEGIDQAEEAYKLFDSQVDGKGVFLM